ncbi:hypothetical protein APA35_28855 [Pseudomonas aeruginosa]|nr:hypothetical protein APA35_28855 [Pseudomonas aeruginosa]
MALGSAAPGLPPRPGRPSEDGAEAGVVDLALVGTDGALQLADLGFLGIQGLLGDRVLGIQPLVALQVDLGVLQLRLVLHQRALGLGQRRLVGARVDHRQQVAQTACSVTDEGLK